MLKNKLNVEKVNLSAAKLAISLSIGMCAMVLAVFSTSAQQISVVEHESVLVQGAAQPAAISASTLPTGTATTPNGNLPVQLHFAIIIYPTGSIGTATIPDPGTSTNPPGTQTYYVPFFHIN